jgi:hypothetical protein
VKTEKDEDVNTMTRKGSTGAKPVIFPSKKKFYTSSKKKVSNEEVEIRN